MVNRQFPAMKTPYCFYAKNFTQVTRARYIHSCGRRIGGRGVPMPRYSFFWAAGGASVRPAGLAGSVLNMNAGAVPGEGNSEIVAGGAARRGTAQLLGGMHTGRRARRSEAGGSGGGAASASLAVQGSADSRNRGISSRSAAGQKASLPPSRKPRGNLPALLPRRESPT